MNSLSALNGVPSNIGVPEETIYLMTLIQWQATLILSGPQLWPAMGLAGPNLSVLAIMMTENIFIFILFTFKELIKSKSVFLNEIQSIYILFIILSIP